MSEENPKLTFRIPLGEFIAYTCVVVAAGALWGWEYGLLSYGIADLFLKFAEKTSGRTVVIKTQEPKT